MSNLSSGLVIPDSLLAKEATDLLREHSTDLLFNHSMRVYFFAAEMGRQRKLRFECFEYCDYFDFMLYYPRYQTRGRIDGHADSRAF